MPTKTDNQVIYDVIRTMIAANASVSNSEMAEEATQRLRKPVTPSDISRLRDDIGLSIHQMAERDTARALQLALEKIVDPLLNLGDLAAAAIAPANFPRKHTVYGIIMRRFKDLLYRWAPDFAADVVVAARERSGPVVLRLDMLEFEPDLLYACLWYASNFEIEVHVLPSQPKPMSSGDKVS